MENIVLQVKDGMCSSRRHLAEVAKHQLPTTLLVFEAHLSEKKSAGLYRPIWLLVLLELENFFVLLLKKTKTLFQEK